MRTSSLSVLISGATFCIDKSTYQHSSSEFWGELIWMPRKNCACQVDGIWGTYGLLNLDGTSIGAHWLSSLDLLGYDLFGRHFDAELIQLARKTYQLIN